MANSSYVWLPLLPREDGLGYALLELDEWRPRDYEAQVPPAAHVGACMHDALRPDLAVRRVLQLQVSGLCEYYGIRGCFP